MQKKIILLSAYINYIFQGMGALILSLTLSDLKTIWNASTFQVSVVIGGIGLGRLLFMYISGIISDKLGRKFAILLSSAMYCVFFGVVGFCSNYLLAFACTLIAGFCHALYDTSIYPLITELYPNEKLQSSLSILNKAFISFGQFILPIIVIQFAAMHLAFQAVYLFCVICILFNFILFAFLPVTKEISVVQQQEKNRQRGRLDLPSCLLLVFSFVSVSIFTIFTTWVATYGKDILQMTKAQSSLCVSLYSVCSIVSVFTTAFVVRLGVKRMTIILFDMLMSFIGLLLLNIYPTQIVLYITTVIIGLFAAGGIWQLGLVELLERTNGAKGRYTSYYSLAASLALFLIPSFTGYFADRNLQSVFWIDSLLVAIGLISLIVFKHYQKSDSCKS